MPLVNHKTEIIGETGAQDLMGYVLDVGHPDKRARCRLVVAEQHLNRHKVLHGGIAACLLDSAAGATASLSIDNTGRAPFLSVSLSINYIAPGQPGKVEAIGTITGGGKSLIFVDARLHDDDGNLIATSTGTYKRVSKDRL